MCYRTTADGCLAIRGGIYRLVAVLVAFLLAATTCQPLLAQGRAPAATRTPRNRPRTDPALPPAGNAEVVEDDEEPPPEERTYQEMKVEDALKKNQSAVAQALTRGSFENNDDKQKLDDYCRKYFFPQWSLVKGITELPKERSKLRSYLGKKTTGGTAVHDYLNELVLEFMKELVAGDFHPAVRVNAMLMIGELNRVESSGTPLPEALPVVIAAAEDTKLPTAIRAAAMVGVLRHATAGIQDDEVRKALTTSMVRLASGNLPGGATASGYAWIRMQAIETLAALGSVGEDNAVFHAILKSVADDKLPFFVRSTAADCLGKLNYSSASGINPLETAAALGQLALRTCDEELRLAKKAAAEWQSSRRPGDDPQSAQKPKNFVSHRRMLQRLDAVSSALGSGDEANRKGVASLAREASQLASLDQLQKSIKATCASLDSKDEEKDMKPVVVELQKNLKAWLEKNAK
jgi:hypothetical protein